ncbi:N-acetyltransferase [bacterium]|jgi:ribosomal protein S18 acetylase RimI-like enzyme|nr:N-acetyltransferase [bacterium]
MSTQQFQLKRVESKSDWKDFIDLPWMIYKDSPYWVPPLKIAVKDTLDVNKNPFFKHAWMYPLVAYQNGKCVGRVVGVIDDNHNKYHEEKTAFFGFYEAIENQELTDLMLGEVANWAKSKGMNMLRGPMNPSTNHECGLLIQGFDDTPSVMMTYNPPYYATLLEGWGFAKAKDLNAYYIHGDSKFSEKLIRHSERLKAGGKVTFRTVDMKKFDQEVETILEIYNDAWEKNWGFVPMNPEEFRHMAKDMKAVVDPNLLLMCEVRGEPAGFALALPDINQALKKVPDGKLLPFGLLKLLWNTKGPGKKKTLNRCRILTLGIKKAYREVGIGPLLYTEYLTRGPGNGYPTGEASWILEDNKPMVRGVEYMKGELAKVYRIYDKALS